MRSIPNYDKQNRAAAQIIMANPVRYAGLPYLWAMLWLDLHQQAVLGAKTDQQIPAATQRELVARAKGTA